MAPRITRRALAALLIALLILPMAAPLAEAAGLSLTLHQVDSSQFPKVRAYVSVANSEGKRYTDLDGQSFQLLEDDKPIDSFQVEAIVASQEPVAVALAFDLSGSMNEEGRLDGAKQAAAAFVGAMGPKDSTAVITFSTEVKVVQDFTADQGALKNAINGITAQGDTALYDAIAQSAERVASQPQQRKIVLLLTDGEDTASKGNNPDTAVAAAKKAGAPVFAVGLGQGVKRDVLDKIGGESGGQAVYVANGAELRDVFLRLGDQLRNQYVLQYASKLSGDEKPHNLTVKVNYRGEAAEAKGSFVAKRTPIAVDVKGLTTASRVTGTQRIEVNVLTGIAQQVELLVDDQSRGTAKASPFAIQWDTSKEKPGIHRVVVRTRDSAGSTSDKEFIVEVVGPPATAAPTAPPTAVPTAVPTAAAKVVPTPTPQTANNNLLYAAIAGLVVLLLGGGVGLFLLLRRKPAPPPAPAAPAPKPVEDRTEAIFVAPPPAPPAPVSAPVADATVVGGAASAVAEATIVNTPKMPRARLRILAQGAEQEVVLDSAETILGREPSNPVVVRDPMASRRHAKITREDGEFWIEDLKSLNGTRVNGEVLTARRRLADGDQIKVGDVTLTFRPEPN